MGRAMDLDDTFGHKSNAEMFQYIKDNLSFDQLIWEFGDSIKSCLDSCKLCQKKKTEADAYKAEKVNGRTSYRVI